MQAAATLRDVLDDLILHTSLPEFLQVFGDARDGLFARITREKQRNLICVMDHRAGLHAAILRRLDRSGFL